jgi:hypothetical protein
MSDNTQETIQLTNEAAEVVRKAAEYWEQQNGGFTDNLESKIEDMARNAGLESSEKISVENFGNGNRPSLFVMSESGRELGTIDITREGGLIVTDFAKPDVRDVVKQEVVQEMAEFKETADGLNRNDALKEAEKGLDTSLDDTLKKGFDAINAAYSEAGIDVDRKMQKMQDKMLNKSADRKSEIKSLKSELKDINRRIDGLMEDVQQEISIAKVNGFNRDNADRIEKNCQEIADLTKEAALLKEEIDTYGKTAHFHISDIGEAVKNGFEKMKAAADVKIQSGINTLSNIRDTVRDANAKFYTMKETAYVGLEEKVEAYLRNDWCTRYAADKVSIANIDKIKAGIEHAHDRSVEIKGAFKNLGRAVIGREQQTYEKQEMSAAQQKIIQGLDKIRGMYEKEMGMIESRYEMSKEISVMNIESIQELRQDNGLDVSKSLDARIADIQKAKFGETKEKVNVKAAPSLGDGR